MKKGRWSRSRVGKKTTEWLKEVEEGRCFVGAWLLVGFVLSAKNKNEVEMSPDLESN